MKLLYHNTTGEVWYAVYDLDLFKFKHTTNIPLSEFNIDEIDPENLDICFDLFRTQWKFNDAWQRKYYIENNELYVRDGWTEQIFI